MIEADSYLAGFRGMAQNFENVRQQFKGQDERTVIGQAVNGCASAFTFLTMEYYPKVASFVGSRNGNGLDCENVTQQVFVKAYLAIQNYNPDGGSFGSWIFTIAKNSIIDAHRRTGSHPKRAPLSLEEVTESGYAPVSGSFQEEVEKRIDNQVLSEKVMKYAKNHLSPIRFQALEVRFARGLTDVQAAEVLQIPLSTFKSHIFRAIEVLRKNIDTIAA